MKKSWIFLVLLLCLLVFLNECCWKNSSSDKPSQTTARSTVTLMQSSSHTTTYYVLNTSTKKIHKPSCSWVALIDDDNYSTVSLLSGNLSNYEQKGYTYCEHCFD